MSPHPLSRSSAPFGAVRPWRSGRRWHDPSTRPASPHAVPLQH